MTNRPWDCRQWRAHRRSAVSRYSQTWSWWGESWGSAAPATSLPTTGIWATSPYIEKIKSREIVKNRREGGGQLVFRLNLVWIRIGNQPKISIRHEPMRIWTRIQCGSGSRLFPKRDICMTRPKGIYQARRLPSDQKKQNVDTLKYEETE